MVKIRASGSPLPLAHRPVGEYPPKPDRSLNNTVRQKIKSPMCFVLYIASNKPLPIIPWDPDADCVHTEDLPEAAVAFRSHFTGRHVYYVGSDTNCGCGYRHATYNNGSWPDEEWRLEDDAREAQPNHERLVRLIREHLEGEESCELYGVWDGSSIDPAVCHLDITLQGLQELDFCFRERCHYTVQLLG